MNLHPVSLILRCASLRRAILCAGLAAAVSPCARAAVTWHDVQFGGFASQGFLANTGNNDYLGETSEGTFDFREYAVNASWSKGKFRVGAQAFGQKLGAYGDDKIKLDWATVDYQAAQWFGVRAGRVKMPRGLYNEALDLDSVRPFVLLPQSVYDARLRDFNSAFNGGMVFGNVEVRKAGSFDYRVFYGGMNLSTESGASDYFNNDAPFPNHRFEMSATYGGTLFWNTTVPGLRIGYSYTAFKNFGADRDIPAPFDVYRNTKLYGRNLFSAEYVTGDWTLAAEAGRENAHFDIAPVGSPGQFTQDVVNKYGYLSIARRINSWCELGSYYSYSKDTIKSTQSVSFPDLIQKDFALSSKFDLNEHVIFKLEGHYLDGAGKLFNTAAHPQPIASRDNSWMMIAAKVTVSF